VSVLARAALLLVALFAIRGVMAADQNTPPPADWIEITAEGRFSLMAPAGTTFQRSSGIDSFTGVFNAPEFALHVDYGPHSDPLDRDRGRTQYVARAISIDGKPARVVTARERAAQRPYFIGMHIPALKRSAVGAIGLTLYCHVERQQEYAIIESVYRSVRFK
jgi:hypothetical protein